MKKNYFLHSLPFRLLVGVAFGICIGSKMFIDKDGNSYGSIGGGNVEFQALKYAPEAQHGEIRKYNLSNQGGANLGMICGGEVEVLYELL